LEIGSWMDFLEDEYFLWGENEDEVGEAAVDVVV
jgi:hypothetical protein